MIQFCCSKKDALLVLAGCRTVFLTIKTQIFIPLLHPKERQDMAGAPIGNQNAQKGRLWNDALRRAIAQDDGKRLRASIEQLLNLASNGEPWAIKELADRLDGRPKQTNPIGATDDALVKEIKMIFVSPDGKESEDITNLNI